MAKNVAKCSWEENYQNKSLSGIEVRDKNGKLLGFITIKHNEVLEDNTTHRITIKVDENAEPILPPARTFEEIIQAKRRQQMLLYGSGTSTTSTLSDRTARRVAAAARQTVAASTNSHLIRSQPTTNTTTTRPSTSRPNSKSKKKKITSSIKLPKHIAAAPGSPVTSIKEELSSSKTTTETPVPACKPATVSPKSKSHLAPTTTPQVGISPNQPTPGTSAASSSPSSVVTSMRDFKKNMPSLPIDTKELKLILKSAPPGACVVLADGTIVKKSRRGGARAGAGRKRSRPLPANHQAATANSNPPT